MSPVIQVMLLLQLVYHSSVRVSSGLIEERLTGITSTLLEHHRGTYCRLQYVTASLSTFNISHCYSYFVGLYQNTKSVISRHSSCLVQHVPVQSSTERMGIGWTSADTSRECCSFSFSFTQEIEYCFCYVHRNCICASTQTSCLNGLTFPFFLL